MAAATRRHLLGSGLRLAVLAGGGMALAGCGFQPLYGQNAGGGSVNEDLALVRIAPLSDRTGQKLHNLLRDRLNPYGQPREPLYELRLSLREVVSETGIRRDETASRAILTVLAGFALIELESRAAVLQGQSRSSSAYNILDNRYASAVSSDDALDRALRELAEDIKLRLAAHFSAQRV